ncbi:MAG: Type IV pilus biogenesis protein PilZ [Olavius algarvensis Gamma 1 endosymbiont]|nr:MAG: Type IV pilus biogenesis protein PilZ [Olavius algarvensis Gamma 1 endosymbiont]
METRRAITVDPEAPGGQQRILSCVIEDKPALYAAFMPFIKNGGLFIPTDRHYRIGDEVFLLLRLMDESERIPIVGKVVWSTPAGAEGQPRGRCRHPVQRSGPGRRSPQDRGLPRRYAHLEPSYLSDPG